MTKPNLETNTQLKGEKKKSKQTKIKIGKCKTTTGLV